MTITILGNTGLVGSAIEVVFKNNNIQVKGYNRSNLDIKDTKSLKNEIEIHKPKIIINTVAIIDENKISQDPSNAFIVNTCINLELIYICNYYNIKLIYISTVEVFSGNKHEAYEEIDIPLPKNIYGCTKRNSETLIENHSNNELVSCSLVMINGVKT